MTAGAAVALVLVCAVSHSVSTLHSPRRHHTPAHPSFLSTVCLDGVYAHAGADAAKLCDSGYNLRIERWHARLGNVLHQVTHGVYVAAQTRSRLTVPPAPLLTRTEWDFRGLDDMMSPCSRITITGGDPNFWHPRDCAALAAATPAAKRDVLTRYIVPHLEVGTAATHVDHDMLVIYLRSGDVFAGDGGSGWYVQPPIAFYRAVLTRRAWRRVVVVTDRSNATLLNPVLNVLTREWPTLEMAPIASLADDVATLVASTNIVSARSTLADAVLLIGPPKTCAYLPACEGHEDERAAGGVCYTMDGYTVQGTWSNSEAQRQGMLTYKGVREGRVWGKGC